LNGFLAVPEFSAAGKLVADESAEEQILDYVDRFYSPIIHRAVTLAIQSLDAPDASRGLTLGEVGRRSAYWALNGKAIARQSVAERLRGRRLGPLVNVGDVQGRLPGNSILVEFLKYQRFDRPLQTNGKRPLFYVAWVIPAGRGEIRLVMIGADDDIDDVVKELMQSISADPPSDYRRPIGQLRNKLLDSLPTEPELLLDAPNRWWILAPTADLWLVPFEALPSPGGQFAVELHKISYQITGRDVLANTPSRGGTNPRSAPFIMANPDFNSTLATVGRSDSRRVSYRNELASSSIVAGGQFAASTESAMGAPRSASQPVSLIRTTYLRPAGSENKHLLTIAGHGFRWRRGTRRNDSQHVVYQDPTGRCKYYYFPFCRQPVPPCPFPGDGPGPDRKGHLLGQELMAAFPLMPGSPTLSIGSGPFGTFPAEPSTRALAQDIARIIGLPNDQVLLDGRAQEATFKATFPRPAVSGQGRTDVVICTHGFFLEPTPDPRPAALVINPDPLMRCGLGLAGANNRASFDLTPSGQPEIIESGVNDGILTGREIVAQCDLRETDLVALIACETGVGVPTRSRLYGTVAGDSLASMRHAFTLAGARTVLATGWKVPLSPPSGPDHTMLLMHEFFTNRIRMGDEEGLRQAQISLLRLYPGLHPYYWASFTLTGQWD
jgi:hypothetical protein